MAIQPARIHRLPIAVEHHVLSFLGTTADHMNYANSCSLAQERVARADTIWKRHAARTGLKLEKNCWTPFEQFKEHRTMLLLERAVQEAVKEKDFAEIVSDHTGKEIGQERQSSFTGSMCAITASALMSDTTNSWRVATLIAHLPKYMHTLSSAENSKRRAVKRVLAGFSFLAGAYALYDTNFRVAVPIVLNANLILDAPDKTERRNYAHYAENDEHYVKQSRQVLIARCALMIIYSTSRLWRAAMVVSCLPYCMEYLPTTENRKWKRAVKVLAIGFMGVGAVAMVYNDPGAGLLCFALNLSAFLRACHSLNYKKRYSRLVEIAIIDWGLPHMANHQMQDTLRQSPCMKVRNLFGRVSRAVTWAIEPLARLARPPM